MKLSAQIVVKPSHNNVGKAVANVKLNDILFAIGASYDLLLHILGNIQIQIC